MDHHIIKHNDNKQVQVLTPAASSKKLIQCLVKLETAERSDAKMELITITSELMPAGAPKYLDVIKYPMIRELIETEGRKNMLAIVVLMVKDFCSTMNVVRNMNEDQMIEAAAMMLDECDNFRIEDYLMMFSLAKRGKLVKIFDRIDLEVITNIMDAYWEKRRDAAIKVHEEEHKRLDSIGSINRSLEIINTIDAKMMESVDGLAAAFDRLRIGMTDNGIERKSTDGQT